MTPSALVPAQKPTAVCVRQRYSVVCSTPASLTAVNVGLATGTFSPRGRWLKSLDMCCLCICAKWENRFGIAVATRVPPLQRAVRRQQYAKSGGRRLARRGRFLLYSRCSGGIVLYRNFHLVRPLCEREETRVLQSDYSFTYFVRATFSHSHRTDALCLFFQLRE